MISNGTFFLMMLLLGQCSVFGQQCPGSPAKLIQSTQLLQHDLETRDDVTDYTECLRTFLGNCTFNRVAEITSKGGCHYECLYGSGRCYAMTYAAAGGCQICRPTSEPGNGNSYPLDDVFVAGWNLKTHING